MPFSFSSANHHHSPSPARPSDQCEVAHHDTHHHEDFPAMTTTISSSSAAPLSSTASSSSASASISPSLSPSLQSRREEEDPKLALLHEMINLSCGMMPSTQSTEGLFMKHLRECSSVSRGDGSSTATPSKNLAARRMEEDSRLLREMVHLTCGLPPNTISTERVLNDAAAADHTTTCSTNQMVVRDDGAADATADDDLLRQMVHMSMGLPVATASTEAIFSTSAANSTNNKTAAEEEDSDELLHQMIHLSMGLPVTTSSTEGVYNRHQQQHESVANVTNAHHLQHDDDDDDVDADEALRQAIHMMVGLPPTTKSTAAVLKHLSQKKKDEDGADADADAHSTKGGASLWSLGSQIVATAGLMKALLRPVSPQTHSSSSLSASPSSTCPAVNDVASASYFSNSREMFQSAAGRLFPISSGRSRSNTTTAASPEAAAAARSARKAKATAPSGIPEELLGF